MATKKDDLWRLERDSLGEVRVPAARLYGGQTQRAIENFPVSGTPIPREVIAALAECKRAAALVNLRLDRLEPRVAQAIVAAADEIIAGHHGEEFPVDVYQTGSGTSSNMNVNEVIANRACQILGAPLGGKDPVHPNDHVNLGQSSNDVFLTAVHIAAVRALDRELMPALRALTVALRSKAEDWRDVVAMGRTHLMDAMPLRLGDVFGGYAAMLEHAAARLRATRADLLRVPLGGTAVGAGHGTSAAYVTAMLETLCARLGLPLARADDSFRALSAPQALFALSATLRLLAMDLAKLANDIRWLASGPRAGLGELALPAVQPGSSIMPGKVNPVMNEMLLMVSAQVIGFDTAITWCAQSSNFQLNTALPLVAFNLDQALTVLSRGMSAFTQRCVLGLQANRERCGKAVEESLALATALVPQLGYDGAAALAHEAHAHGETIRAAARRLGVLDEASLAEALDVNRLSARLCWE